MEFLEGFRDFRPMRLCVKGFGFDEGSYTYALGEVSVSWGWALYVSIALLSCHLHFASPASRFLSALELFENYRAPQGLKPSKPFSQQVATPSKANPRRLYVSC